MKILKKDKKAILKTLKTDVHLKNFFLKPHTITALVLTVLFLIYLSIYKENNNIITGIVISYFVFLLISLLQFTDSVFRRPFPAFWRLVKGTSIYYLMLLIIVLFQDKHTVRIWLKNIDKTLGVHLPEKDYGANCALTVKNVYDQMDMFVPAHIFGWYFKALMLRDYYLCWILSILFEIMEYSLAHQLPNFGECWWDHWILDVLTCNAAGIHLGIKTCHYFKTKLYKWRGNVDDNPLVLQHWIASADTFKKYVGLISLIIFINMAEMNTFYLKSLLWIPPEHILNVLRLILHVLMGCVAIREGYSYFIDKTCKNFGYQVWLCIACIITESLICIKFGKGEFPNPAPTNVKIFWIIIIIFVVAFPIYKYVPWKKLKNKVD